MDNTKVLWSSEQETDKIFNIYRGTLTIPAGQTSSPLTILNSMNVVGWQPPEELRDPGTTGKGFMGGYRWMAYYKSAGSNVWMPSSNVTGSAAMAPSGVSLAVSFWGLQGCSLAAFSSSTSGAARSIEYVLMLAPVVKGVVNVGGVDWHIGTPAVVPFNQGKAPDPKWSSFDKQGSIAGKRLITFTADGTARRLATIPHGQGKRPTVLFCTGKMGFAFPAALLGPGSEYVSIWKDNTNIYVEYQPTGFPGGPYATVQLWWYNE